MDEAETKTCTNCKREIPAVNFTTHAVHCARNIKVCPVCKEPVPQAELHDHHEKMHKLLPCKKCGEMVCGTDLEDHIRDSCAHTVKSCRYCELELPRRELPAHEGYCGARTEQCEECREWVMIKYRALHRDSNHGFLRLDDDPVPQPNKPMATTNNPPRKIDFSRYLNPGPVNLAPIRPAPTNLSPTRPVPANLATTRPAPANLAPTRLATANSAASSNGFVKNTNVEQDAAREEGCSPVRSTLADFFRNPLQDREPLRLSRPGPSAEPVASGSRLPTKRTNDQPQINTNMASTEKVNKDLGTSRGAVKKRQAPKPPTVPAPDPRRDLAYYSALQRQQDEERERQEQTARNLAQGLPPVLSPAAKLERLRKMDALHNRETEPPRPHRPRSPQPPQNLQPQYQQVPANQPDMRHEFRDIKPMNPEEFMRRFQSLQVDRPNGSGSRSNGESSRSNENGPPINGNSQSDPVRPSRSNGRSEAGRSNGDSGAANNGRGGDRFNEIKSSLRELRRGLNEVTAPYNSSNDVEINSLPRGRLSPGPVLADSNSDSEASDVLIPCEFCCRPIPCDQLVIHQTGCRPDLAQLKAKVDDELQEQDRRLRQQLRRQLQRERQQQLQQRQQRQQQRQQRLQQRQQQEQQRQPLAPHPEGQPVIPCEFCTESLPVYLISEHQERCRRDGPMLYPD